MSYGQSPTQLLQSTRLSRVLHLPTASSYLRQNTKKEPLIVRLQCAKHRNHLQPQDSLLSGYGIPLMALSNYLCFLLLCLALPLRLPKFISQCQAQPQQR